MSGISTPAIGSVTATANGITTVGPAVSSPIITWSWTPSTPVNTVKSIANNSMVYNCLTLQANPNANVGVHSISITIEGSIDGVNYNPINVQQINGETGLYPYNGTSLYLPASIPIIYQCAITFPYTRVSLTTALTGAGAQVDFYAVLSTNTNFGAASEQGVSIIDPVSGYVAGVSTTQGMKSSVLDVLGISTAGQKAMAGSVPVVIASDQAVFPVNVQLSGTALKDDANFGDGVTSGVASIHPRLFNGTSYDRWRGDTTSGAWVNVKNTTLAVTQSGTWTVGISSNTSVGSAQATVTTAGTRVQLGTNTCKSVTVKAKGTNTGLIYVGTSTVASSNGLILNAGEAVSMDITNTNLVYIDSSVNGEGVSYIFVN